MKVKILTAIGAVVMAHVYAALFFVDIMSSGQKLIYLMAVILWCVAFAAILSEYSDEGGRDE